MPLEALTYMSNPRNLKRKWRTTLVGTIVEVCIVLSMTHLVPSGTGIFRTVGVAGVIGITVPIVFAVSSEPAIGVFVALVGAITFLPYLSTQPSTTWEHYILITASWTLATFIVASASIRDRKQREQLLSRILSAQSEERRQIAHDLHDDTIQILVAVLFQFDRMDHDERRHPALQSAMLLTRDALRRLRDLSFQLQPPVLSERGLQPALEDLCTHMQKQFHDLRCEMTFYIFVKRRYSSATEELTHRFVLEALQNCFKHAHASKVLVRVIDHVTGLHVHVEDNGRGFDPEKMRRPSTQASLGMPSRIEQIKWAGGTVKIRSHPGCTIITADLPTTQAH